MIDVFLQTIPFFAIIGLGYGAARIGFFPEDATTYLTKFVFYFALSAMIFRFAASLNLQDYFHWHFILAYLLASFFVYFLATGVALIRGVGIAEGAVEAQCAVIGNVGFLGIPMIALLFGERAIGFVMLVLAMDLVVFSSLIVILITGSKGTNSGIGVLATVGTGLIKNPMIVSIVLGLAFSKSGLVMPVSVQTFLEILGAAATPGALFAIGASLASKSAERLVVAGWISFAKLILHPAAVAIAALYLFDVDPFGAAIMIAVAAMPVAGNVYMIAQHYGVAPLRVSASILISTTVSIVTLSLVIAWVSG